jgi:hypothetical protein
MPQCPTCGSNVPEQADVCQDCGMDLTNAQTPAAAAPLPSFTPPALEMAPAPSVSPDPPASSALGGQLARLTLKRSGVLTSESFQFGDHVVVGRFDPDSGPVDVDLGPLPEAAYVSRHHAEIWCDAGGEWFIKDAGSRNGTFVRSTGQHQFQRIASEQVIRDHDEIALGNARFEFQLG